MKIRFFRYVFVPLAVGIAACSLFPASIPTPLPSSPQPSLQIGTTNQPSMTAPPDVFVVDTPGPTITPMPTATTLPTLATGSAITLTGSLAMFNKTTGWAIEATGHIVRTADGGSSWQDVTPPQGAYKEGGFFALDADTAWATPFFSSLQNFNSTTIWRTTDGGATWQPSQTLCLGGGECGYDYPMSPEYLDTVATQFVDENTGWMLIAVAHLMMQDRYRVYRTVDGGENWTMVSDSMGAPMAFSVTGLAFLDAQTGWFGTSNVGMGPDSMLNWSIDQTQDGGITWETVLLPAPTNLPADFSASTFACGVENVSTILLHVVDLGIYCDVYKEDARPRYHFHYHSVDGGQTWNSWRASDRTVKFDGLSISGSWQSTVNESFLDAATGWRLFASDPAQPNQLQKTTDGGSTWVTLKTVAWESARFDFVNQQVGWAIVTRGGAIALVHTTDGGQTWQELKPTP